MGFKVYGAIGAKWASLGGTGFAREVRSRAAERFCMQGRPSRPDVPTHGTP